MRFGISIVGDIVRLVDTEVKAGEKAVTTMLRVAGTSLKTAWHAQITGAGLVQCVGHHRRA